MGSRIDVPAHGLIKSAALAWTIRLHAARFENTGISSLIIAVVIRVQT